MSFDYDEYTNSGDYVSWNNPGDQVVGTIKDRRTGNDFHGNECMEFVLEVNDDGDETTLTVSQWMLTKLFTEQRPSIGDRIRVTYTGNETTDRGRTVKMFTLDVKTGVAESLIQPAVANSTEPF